MTARFLAGNCRFFPYLIPKCIIMILLRHFRPLLVISLIFLFNSIYGQTAFDVFDYWPYLPDPGNTLYQEILSRAEVQLSNRKTKISALKSKDDWLMRQREVKKKLDKLLLPPWNRTPLNAVITATLDRPDFTVEKLIYESFPGYPVSAALFLPKQQKGPMPAILFCSGHSDEGFRSSVYQHMILNYVKKGFIVLAFDPVGQGERNQYFFEDGKKKFRPTHEHSYVGNQIFLTGHSPAQYFVWDGMRAIDYLTSRPEVDPDRIGVTGRSGGGTQSAYLMAVDDRILAAAPECYLTTFEYLLRSGGPQDAEQNIPGLLKEGLDLPDLVEVRAPKPTLMVTTTRDIFSIQGARELYNEAKQIYQLFNAKEELSMVEDDAPHQSTVKNREATYRFFQKYLNNPGNSKDEEVEIFGIEELWVSSSGQLLTDGFNETLFSVQKNKFEKIKDVTVGSSNKEIKDLVSYEGSYVYQPIFSGTIQYSKYSLDKYLLKINENYSIPVIWLKPKPYSSSNPKIVLVVNDLGKQVHQDSTDIIFDLLGAGYQVILPDLSGYGELSDAFTGDAYIDAVPLNIWYAGVLTGRYPISLRAEELSMINRFVQSLLGADAKPIALGYGSASIDLIMASSIGIEYHSLVLNDCLYSVENLISSKIYPLKYIPSLVAGGLDSFDIPDLIQQSHIPVQLINPVLMDEEKGQMNLVNAIGDPVEVKYINDPVKIKEVILKWLN